MKLPILLSNSILASFLVWSLPFARAQSTRGFSRAQNSKLRRLQGDNQTADNHTDYIVVYKDQLVAGTDAVTEADDEAVKVQVQSSVETLGGTVTNTYSDAISGFAAKLTPEALQALEADDSVAYIVPDSKVTMFTTQTGDNVPWGIDRIDQTAGEDGNYTYDATGAGVHAYIFDTGISSLHTDFTGRFGDGFNAIYPPSNPAEWDDCQGHGTHVASVVGGTINGVAKGVTLHAVRVLDCNGEGSVSNIVSGINWLIKVQKANKSQKSVVNLSFGSSDKSNFLLNLAVQRLALNGVLVVAAAGNSNDNACNVSPASVSCVLTTGATDISDQRWSSSNYGACVDIFAPGLEITGAGIQCPTCTAVLSGTSIASAHVAGVAALYFEKLNGGSGVIRKAILDHALNNIVKKPFTLPNKFLQSAVPAACRAQGKICRKRLCKRSLSCCCSGLKCKGIGLGKCS